MTVEGHVDGFEGRYLVGWAAARAGAPPCQITVLNSAGICVSMGVANNERADLAALNVGRTDFAFRLPGIRLDVPGRLRVYADGNELANSPLVIGPGVFDGGLEVAGGVARGWVFERSVTRSLREIRILDDADDVLVRHVLDTRDESGDINQFCLDLPQRAFGRGEIHLRAMANDTVVHRTSCNLGLIGNVEFISTERCSGWLFSPDAPGLEFELEILIDGRVAATTRCNLRRDDVKALHPTCQNSGFDVSLPRRPDGEFGFANIVLRIPGSSYPLLDSPYVVAGRNAAIMAAQKLSRIALDADNELSGGDRSVLQKALATFVAAQRLSEHYHSRRQAHFIPGASARIRCNVIIPIYRDVAVTQACIESALATRSPLDRLVLINDGSPDEAMSAMLQRFSLTANVVLLQNAVNLGFVRSMNRGLAYCASGDVIFLNSDTRLFAGGLDELWRVAHSDAAIGTATAISNKATIFSYPHPTLRPDALADMTWEELAAAALRLNAGLALDVPTGHGFCLFIKRAVLDRVGVLDEAFGRGYGEENDLCMRAADLGFRHVAAPGVFVVHLEGVSFRTETKALIAKNIERLQSRYPEYTPLIMDSERRDDLRRGRWALDAHRLSTAAAASGSSYALLICNALGGGTDQAIHDIEAAVGYGSATKLTLRCRTDGHMELSAAEPQVLALFAPTEADCLFKLLDALPLSLVVCHQLLGFTRGFIEQLADWVPSRHAIFYAHDFYAVCPRVTLIDAADEFCRAAPSASCARCIDIGGAHALSRLGSFDPVAHRALFARVLGAFRHVVCPSKDTAAYIKQALPQLTLAVVPHPEAGKRFPRGVRKGTNAEVVLFGAIGPHKGSARLLELARRARLTHPALRFHVIGCTDIDAALLALGNVSITGRYAPAELAQHCAASVGRLALFLSMWPETYSYTLSEAVRFGFIPLVPDIGAPAERVRAAGFGVVFDFPFTAASVLEVIAGITRGDRAWATGSATPASFATGADRVRRLRQLLTPPRAAWAATP